MLAHFCFLFFLLLHFVHHLLAKILSPFIILPPDFTNTYLYLHLHPHFVGYILFFRTLFSYILLCVFSLIPLPLLLLSDDLSATPLLCCFSFTTRRDLILLFPLIIAISEMSFYIVLIISVLTILLSFSLQPSRGTSIRSNSYRSSWLTVFHFQASTANQTKRQKSTEW